MKDLLRPLSTSLTMCLLVTLAALVAIPASSQTEPCEVFDPDHPKASNGLGLPPDCKYLSPGEIKAMDDPVAMEKLLAKPIHQFFVCLTSGSRDWDDCRERQFDGSDKEEFTSEVVLEIEGTDDLGDYRATVVVPDVAVEVHSSPQQEGSTEQHLATEMVSIQGSVTDHPDFEQLTIVGGTANGFPSPGEIHATYDEERQVWVVDSHFDVGYSMSFVGAPGGPLAGRSGSGEGTVRMTAFGHDSDDSEPQEP